MTPREEKAYKRARLLAMLHQDDWLSDKDKLEEIQQFTKKEILHLEKRKPRGGRPSTVNISEEEFLHYVYVGYDYIQISKALNVSIKQLVNWREKHLYSKKTKSQLKQEYVARFLSQGKKGESQNE
ncbi:hypothetical protein [Enterococcus sp. LJL90]